jgi:hypothetical protein
LEERTGPGVLLAGILNVKALAVVVGAPDGGEWVFRATNVAAMALAEGCGMER